MLNAWSIKRIWNHLYFYLKVMLNIWPSSHLQWCTNHLFFNVFFVLIDSEINFPGNIKLFLPQTCRGCRNVSSSIFFYFFFLSLAQEFFGIIRNSNDHHVFCIFLTHSLFLKFYCKRRTTRCFEKSINWWDFEQVQYFSLYFFDFSLATITPCLEVQYFWLVQRNKTSRILIENDVNLSLITHRNNKNLISLDAQFFGLNKQPKILLYYELKKLTVDLESVNNWTRAESGVYLLFHTQNSFSHNLPKS